MLTVLLVIIYIAFISLGLPDAIMGSAWPMIHQDLNVPISVAGAVTIVVSCGTVVASFFSGRCIRKFGTGVVTVVSIALTAIGLIGVYFSTNFVWMCVLGVPLGLGAGAVDAALNNFVALHYKAKHMNWLHCFWGIGATAGPLIMSFYLLRGMSWRMGYITIGILQVILVVCCFFSLPLWRRFEEAQPADADEKADISLKKLVTIPGAKPALVAFFCYCSVEVVAGLWASSYLVMSRGVAPEHAARWVSIFYLGITIGRLVAGFVAIKLNNKMMMRIGQLLSLVGVGIMMLPFSNLFQLIGLVCLGIGCAPIYPAMLHETPNRFGKEISQGIMGIQMAVAYVGILVMPPVAGVLMRAVSFSLLPYILCGLVLIMFITTECVAKICGQNKENL